MARMSPPASPARFFSENEEKRKNAGDPTSAALTPGSGSLNVGTDVDREEAQQGTNVIGDGEFQRLVFGFTIVAQMVLLCHSNVLALITDPVDHWCKPPPDYAGMSANQWKNVGVPADEAGRFSQCRAYVRPGAAPNDTETALCDSWDYDPAEAHRSARSYWDLVCQRSWLLPLGKGVFMSGALIVVPFMGYLADTEGRKPVILISSFVLMMSAIASCFAEAYPIYLVLIFVNSACASTVHIVTVILLFEVSPVQYRTFYTGLGSSLGVVFVELLFIVVTAVRIGWFPLQLLVMAPTLLLLSATFTVYESPMWLLTMSRLKEAEEVIYIAAKANGVSRISTKQALDRIKFEMNKAIVPYAPVAPNALLLPGSLRGRAAAVFVITFIVMLAYYSLTWSHRLGGGSNLVVRVIYVVALVPTYMAMYAALNTLGRLQLMLLLFAILGGFSGLYGIATYAEPGEVAYALAIAAKLVASAAIPTNYLYMAELFPSSVRSAVMCGAYTCGRVGAVFASGLAHLQDIGREDLGFALLATVVFGGLVALLSLPETTVGGAADVTVASMDGNRRDLLDVMQNTLMPTRKKRKMGRRRGSIEPTADTGVGSPLLSSPR
ncbi:solute carrier family 22 member 6 [Rhipicephalus sanguineus]|nr:solute carrier family 22 member 6 [Rhipicephalus sanguineus]